MQVAVKRDGTRWVIPDGTAELLQRRGVKTAPLEYTPYRGQDLDDKRLLVARYGGGGDLMFITGIVRELKRRWPEARIDVICDRKWHFIWTTNRDVRVMSYTSYRGGSYFTAAEVEAHDFLLTFEGVIEADPAPRGNAFDLFFERAGIDPATVPTENKRPHWTPARGDAKKARRLLRGLDLGDRPTVAVQWRSNSPIRTYPPEPLWAVCRELADAGHEVLILGREREVPRWARGGHIHRLAETGARIEVLAALAAEVDLLLGPDSFFVHLAAAVGTPSVALYGPFTAESRVKYYPRCTALEATADCAPCFLHGHRPCPNAAVSSGPCWDSLPPETIVETCLEVLDGSGTERERREEHAQAPA